MLCNFNALALLPSEKGIHIALALLLQSMAHGVIFMSKEVNFSFLGIPLSFALLAGTMIFTARPGRASDLTCTTSVQGVALCDKMLREAPQVTKSKSKVSTKKPAPASEKKPRVELPASLVIDVGTKPLLSSNGGLEFHAAADSDNQLLEYQEKKDFQIIKYSSDQVKSGASCAPGKELRPVEQPETILPCFDAWPKSGWKEKPLGKLLESNADPASVKNGFAQMLRCFDSCISESDAQFLSHCPDFQCSEQVLAAARKSGAFQDTGADPQTGKCRKSEDEQLMEQLRKEFELTKSCPKTFSDISRLRKIAGKFIQGDFLQPDKLKVTYPTDKVPKPGFNYSLTTTKDSNFQACGYNGNWAPLRTWFQTKGNMMTKDYFYEQSNDNTAILCGKWVRASKGSPIFKLEGKECLGDKSYRSGGNIGDQILIPAGEKVWIRLVLLPTNAKDAIIFTGLVFED